MRTLTSALATQLGLTITRPGYLVQIDYPTTVRLSSLGDTTWSGLSWVGADIKLSGLSADGAGRSAGTMQIGNTDLSAGALVLLYGVSDRRVRVWAVWAGALADADVVQVFDGVGDDAQIDARSVVIRLASAGTRSLSSPRRFIGAGTGFSRLRPAGTRITWNGEPYVFEREDS